MTRPPTMGIFCFLFWLAVTREDAIIVAFDFSAISYSKLVSPFLPLLRQGVRLPVASPVATVPLALSVTTALLRGGGPVGVEGYSTASEALINLDLNRVRIRLEGLSAYTVVSTLLLNASLRLFSATPKEFKNDIMSSENAVKIAFCASIVVSILSGVYTTVVFSLLGLYTKTALGLAKDLAYLELMGATQAVRKYAFDSFMISLVSFQSAFVSSLFLNYNGRARWWSSGLAALVVLVSLWHWGFIMATAKRVLFAG